MGSHEFYYIIINFIDDHNFMRSCSFCSKHKNLSSRRKEICRKYCSDSLHDKIQNFKLNDFDHVLLDGRMRSTIKFLKLINHHLFCYSWYSNHKCSKNFKQIRIYKKYVYTPTIINIANFESMKPSVILEFGESVKQIRNEHSICEIYRMNNSHKDCLLKHFRYAQALIY